ncbi:MAG TPA: class I SAM-dependent methyltransferase, partial [Pyrinomonadaceae bacterium]|nr:class I SAM-dependent methyltransferase [Pyrinomonadaceae bacterium]
VAAHGAKVIGVDISPELIELAEKRLEQHEMADLADFRVGSAHELPLEDESVDVVFGMAILHHLDLKLASDEVFRVLKKGGRAIFLEPVRNSKLIKFVRNLIPYTQPDVSPFERPLTDAELKEFSARFTNYKSRAFSLPFVNLIEVLGMSENTFHKATKIDGKILQKSKFLNYYASVRVIEMTK